MSTDFCEGFLVDFNSIKVRLKLKKFIFSLSEKLFQFHKGTIKTLLMIVLVIGVILFQFHKGTIKTNVL